MLFRSKKSTHAPVGFAGPVKLPEMRIIADLTIDGLRNAVAGGNAADRHYVNVNPGRDFPMPELRDLRKVQAGDPCPRCGKPLALARGLEVGHVFKLGSVYSKKMKATFSDADGKDHPFVMGCYGIGVSRCVASAIEQNHDAKGIVWPATLAPYHAVVIATNMENAEVRLEAARITAALEAYGIECLFDDRADVSAGVKFKDAELVGIPVQAVVGPKGLKEDIIEVKVRKTGEMQKVPSAGAPGIIRDTVQRLLAELNVGAAG